MKKDIRSELMHDDDYSSGDYAEYEIMDYDGEDTEEDLYETHKGNKEEKIDDEIRFVNLYNANIPVDSDEQARKRYSRIAWIMNNGTPEQKRQAGEEACLHMKGLVKDFIRKYRNYLQRDPDFADDLMQEAYTNIIKYAGRYREDLGAPSTFFYYYINSAVSGITTKMKHYMSYSDATLKKKILYLQKVYAENNAELTEGDIHIETDESLSKIRSVLQMMSRDMNTHLEAIQDYGEFIAGDPDTNSTYASPESVAIKNKNYEDIVRIMVSKYGIDDVQMFIDCRVNNVSYREIAERHPGMTEDIIRRKIDDMVHAFQYDPAIRKYGKGYIPEDRTDLVGISLMPTEGINKEMDMLEEMLPLDI